MVLKFGLPDSLPTSRSHEGSVLRTLWIQNGVRYTQSVFVSRVVVGKLDTTLDQRAIPVLIIAIEGENTNGVYAEGFASLSAESGGKLQFLELTNGCVWRLVGGRQHVLGTVQIPDPGIRVSRGDKLKFSGNIPPSIKGSLGLAIPFSPLEEAELESLKDLELEKELRQAIRSGEKKDNSGIELVFGP